MSESATQPVRDLRRGDVTWSTGSIGKYSLLWQRWAGRFCLLLPSFSFFDRSSKKLISPASIIFVTAWRA